MVIHMRKLPWAIVLFLKSSLVFASGDTIVGNSASEAIAKSSSAAMAGADASAVTGPVDASSIVNTGDSRALALAHGLGDVDIAQCLASTQWGTVIFSRQGVILNKWCAAEVYDSRGMHEMAARLRCDIKEIKKFFKDDPEGCILANTYVPPAPTLPGRGPDDEETRPDAAGEVSGEGDRDPPVVAIVQQQIEVQQEEVETLAQRIAKIERRNLVAQRREQERKDFAQQTINKLRPPEDDDEER